MATMTYVLALLAVVTAHSASCPANIEDFRTAAVKNNFEPSMLDGQWYEHAYIDIAQVGASCPTFNNTHDEATGVISMALSVKYTIVPFTITEVYTPYNATTRGWYAKRAKMPGGQLLTLPTVVVDATADTMTLYSCINPLHAAQVNELVFASRSRTIDDATLESMKSVAKTAGVVWDDASLKRVDHSKCKDAR